MSKGQTDYGDRIMSLTADDVEAIAEKLCEKMRGPLWVEDIKHYEHHKFIDEQLEDAALMKKSKRDLVERVVGAVSVAGLFMFLGWVAKAGIDLLADLVTKAGGGG